MLAQTFHRFTSGSMGLLPQVALHTAIAAFVIAAVIALLALFAPGRARMRWADITGAAGTAALLVYFGARFAEAGLAPLQNLFEVIALTALCLAGAYFVATRLKPMPALGGFAFPALAAVFVVSLLAAGTVEASDQRAPLSAMAVLHVLLTILAYGVFFMAAVAASMFLIQERALKRHHTPGFARHFPPLESLRKLLHQCLWVGLPLLTAGFALGFGAFSPSQWGALVLTPKVLTALVLWLVLLAGTLGRLTGWLHGRRQSYLVLIGFGLVLATYIGLAMFVRADTDHAAKDPARARVLQEAPCSAL